jgi:glycosyltransferase involved in cell wall biosynthesis
MKKFNSENIKDFVSKPLFDEKVILNKDSSWPKISIVTPSYNQGEFLERTILSVLNQNYPNLEYIIIDGGSTDRSVEIIKKYEKYLTYWVSEKDNGISDAFNKGISHSNGEIIGIINSDDWYEPEAIKNIVNCYMGNIDKDVFHGDMRFYIDNRYLFTIKPDTNYKRIKIEMILNHPTCFVKRDTYLKYGLFKKDYKIAMDYELMLRFYLLGCKFFYIPKIIANMSFEGISDRKALEGSKEVLKIQYSYNLNKIISFHHYLKRCFKYYIKKILGKDNVILQLYRKSSIRKSI